MTKLVSILRTWVRAIFRGERVRDEANEELAFHLEVRAQDLQRNGMTAASAQRQARIEMGQSTRQGERYREAVGLRWLDELGGDLRYAWRMLWRSKGFTAVAVGSLALGIGANTIIFSLAKGVLLDRLTVPHPEQLRLLGVVRVGTNSRARDLWGYGSGMDRNGNRVGAMITYPIYKLMVQQNQAHPVAQPLFAFKDLSGESLTASIDGHASVVNAQMVSGNYYEQLAVRPQLGRGIGPMDDAVAGDGHVVAISDSMWTRLFARSPEVVGKTILLNFVPMTIVGVNPPGFTGASAVQVEPDVFFPLSMQPVLSPQQTDVKDHTSVLDDPELWWVQVMARAKPDVSDATAQVALTTWMQQDVQATMTPMKDKVLPTVAVMDGSQGIGQSNRNFSTQIYVLSALTGFVLLLACANLANLLLARSSTRQREMAVRLALGASRSRVLRQVLTESLLLSSLGGAAGLLLGYLGRDVIPHMYTPSWQLGMLRGDFDGVIFGFTALVSLLTGLLFGVIPAWQATRTSVNTGLKDAAASSTRRRKGWMGRGLVVVQVALSMLLVVGAGLFAATLRNIYKQTPGLETNNILLFAIQAPTARYPGDKAVQLHEWLEERLTRVPGLNGVTLSRHTLFDGGSSTSGLIPSGREWKKGNTPYLHEVGRSFFDVYRIPVLSGRGFDASDTETSPAVGVINQALAKQFWPNENPVGKTFTMVGKHPRVTTVIGIVADTKYVSLTEPEGPTVYFPYRQLDGERVKKMTYELKTPLPAADILPQIHAAIAEIDKDLPLLDVRTQKAQIDATNSQQRTFAMLTGAFGVLALVLACIGIYGLMAYDVARRTNEIGIRMALGAQAGQMMGMVLREATWMAVAGVGIGLGVALWLAKFVKSMLYGLAPNDPWVLGGAAAILLLVALAAGFGPARRASRVEPMVALRHE